MTVFTIRAHRRYALRMPAELQSEGGRTARCLLIELSQDGLRISNLGKRDLTPGEAVRLDMPGGRSMSGKVRWAREGVAGVILDCPLHVPEMSEIIRANQGQSAAA